MIIHMQPVETDKSDQGFPPPCASEEQESTADESPRATTALEDILDYVPAEKALIQLESNTTLVLFRQRPKRSPAPESRKQFKGFSWLFEEPVNLGKRENVYDGLTYLAKKCNEIDTKHARTDKCIIDHFNERQLRLLRLSESITSVTPSLKES